MDGGIDPHLHQETLDGPTNRSPEALFENSPGQADLAGQVVDGVTFFRLHNKPRLNLNHCAVVMGRVPGDGEEHRLEGATSIRPQPSIDDGGFDPPVGFLRGLVYLDFRVRSWEFRVCRSCPHRAGA